jgi:hypothetical protein
VLSFKHNTPSAYLNIIKAQFDQLHEEGEESGTVMCVPLHPYLIGQPHRIGILEEALHYVTGHEKVWLATGREIASWYEQNYYDQFADWMKPFNQTASAEDNR